MTKPRRRCSPGEIRLDPINLEGGISVDVVMDKKTGEFTATYQAVHEMENGEHHDSERWSGKDLEKIRQDVKKWAQEQKALKWEPVIVVIPSDGYRSSRKEVLGQEFYRCMRAKKHRGKDYEWRSWAYQKPGGGFLYDEDLEVYGPGGQAGEPHVFGQHSDVAPVVMEYTPEKWQALLKLVEMEKALRERLFEIVSGGKKELEPFLKRLPSVGLVGLQPKSKK